MATYTFAAADAPVHKHMQGLVMYLDLLAQQQKGESETARTAREREMGRIMAFTYRRVIEIIEESNSI